MSGVAFIDTETTGLDPVRNPIWEIAVIVDDVEHCWHVRLPRDLPVVGDDGPKSPGPYMTEWVLENTRWRDVYDDDLALSPRRAIEKFAELVAGRHLVGAVPSFDEERLRAMYREYIDSDTTLYPWHYHLIDVEALAVGYLHGMGSQMSSPEDWLTPLPWDSSDSFPGAPERWSVILAASDGSEWPIRDVSIGWSADTEAEAQSHLDELPGEFWLYGAGPRPVLIAKDRLTLHHEPAFPPRDYDCHRCGWPRDEHGAMS